MTLISSIIQDALREANIIRLGGTPTSEQTTEALRLYNANINYIYGNPAGEPLTDWPLGVYGAESGYELPYSDAALTHPTINLRLIATAEEAKTVYLTDWPQDGSRMGIIDPFNRLATYPVTLDANGRTIEGAATLALNTNGLNRTWFYRADTGNWVRLTGFTDPTTEQNPFPEEFDMFFIIGLALRLNPRYGRTIDDQSAAMYKDARRAFIARYLQSAPLEIDDSLSWPFMSAQGYDQQREFSSNQAFNRGWYGR